MASKFQASGPFLRIGLGGVEQLPTLFTKATSNFRENLHAVHAQYLGQLANRARSNFYSSIQRPAESGEGEGSRRETGHFTFGGDGSAFVGRLMEKGNRYGFGWPDVDRADQATNFVWRSLEFGLRGTRNAPSTLYLQDTGSFFPRSHHKLPRAFYFKPGGGPSVDVLVPMKGGRYRQASQRPRPRWGKPRGPKEQTMGAGIVGRHFLEVSWLETKIGNPEKYDRVVQKSFYAFK